MRRTASSSQSSESHAEEDAMSQQTDSYRIRLARPDEVPRLQAIEDEAGTIFGGLGLDRRGARRVVRPGRSGSPCRPGAGLGGLPGGRPPRGHGDCLSAGGGRVHRGDGRPASPWRARARCPSTRLRLCVGAGAGPRGGHPLDLPRCAVQRAVLQKARLQDLRPKEWTPACGRSADLPIPASPDTNTAWPPAAAIPARVPSNSFITSDRSNRPITGGAPPGRRSSMAARSPKTVTL
jgi:hypothetical protein